MTLGQERGPRVGERPLTDGRRQPWMPGGAWEHAVPDVGVIVRREHWSARAELSRGLDALRNGDLAPHVLARRAEGWLRQFEALRREVRRMTATRSDEIAMNLDAALVSYIAAAENARLVERAGGGTRRELLNRAALLMEWGDDLYQRARGSWAGGTGS